MNNEKKILKQVKGRFYNYIENELLIYVKVIFVRPNVFPNRGDTSTMVVIEWLFDL